MGRIVAGRLLKDVQVSYPDDPVLNVILRHVSAAGS